MNLDQITQHDHEDNSVIIEEKEIDESTKQSDKRKKSIVFPDIKRASPTPAISEIGKKLIGRQPAYYYSLQFIKSKLGTISTKIIKEETMSSK